MKGKCAVEQSYLEICKIVNTHGLRGDVKVVPWTDYPEIFGKITYVYTSDEEKMKITSVKYQKNFVILHLDKISSIDTAEKMKESVLYVKREDLSPLEENTYYVADLIGLDVFENGLKLGKISDVHRGKWERFVSDDPDSFG